MFDCNDLSLLPLGPAKSSDSELPPPLRRCGFKLYKQAWSAYQKAGCPYGETDKAMLVWYSLYGEDEVTSPTIGRN